MRITKKASSNINLSHITPKINKRQLSSSNNENNSTKRKEKSFVTEKESLINGEPIKVQLVQNYQYKRLYSTKTIDIKTYYNGFLNKQKNDEDNDINNMTNKIPNKIPRRKYKIATESRDNNYEHNNSKYNDLGDIERLKKYLIPNIANQYQYTSSNINRPKVISASPIQKEDFEDDSSRQKKHIKGHKMRDLLSKKFTYNKPKTTSTPNNIKKKQQAYDLKTYFNNDNRRSYRSNKNNIIADNLSVHSFNYKNNEKYKKNKDNLSAISFDNSYSLINKSSNINYKVEIKLDDLIIYDERLNDILVALNNNSNKNHDTDASNECAEFFVFYFHSTLQKIFSSFYNNKNKIVIESANNLTLFIIIITYHLSLNKDILKEVINNIINIYSLVKMNLYLNVKKIQIFYGDTFVENNNFYFKTFNYYLRTQNLINIKEDEIIFKIDHNCRLMTNDIKKILKLYQQINNNYYSDFMAIFNNISILSETDLKDYFYARLYGTANNKKNNNNNLSNAKKRKINIIKNGANNNKKIYKTNEINSENNKNNNYIDNSDVISVKSSKSSHYYGKINKHDFKILKLLNEYEKNKIEAPFIKTPNKKKYSIVLDLDETLINIELKDLTNNKCILHLRPGLFPFLEEIKPFCELMTFTSASKEYALPIINEIESKKKYFDFNFFREHSIIDGNDFVKDISRIGRDMKKIIIIDNMEENFRLNKKNGIKIIPFYGDRNDNVLFELKKILIMIFQQDYEDLSIALEDYSNLIKKKICP